jgi:L-serine dehydratase
VGGGNILITEFDGFSILLSGEYPAIVIKHHDKRGVIADVSGILAKYGVNIGAMEVFRQSRGELASMTIQCDGDIPQCVVENIREIEEIVSVRSVPRL